MARHITDDDHRLDPLWNGAKDALRTAHECEAAALTGDREHADYWLAEAKRHRERAAWYLSRRKMTTYPLEETRERISHYA